MGASTAKTTPVDFSGRVAVVTGAGRGLGRESALLLSQRNAKVVVNDVGVQSECDGSGSDPSRAEAVAREITEAGGDAIADPGTVATTGGAAAIIHRALAAFGRIDVVINNAGFLGPDCSVPETSPELFWNLLNVHVLGAAYVIRAAWPYMEQQRYGRIVNITSGGLFGHPREIAYSAAKAGQYGLTRALAAAGAPSGIHANAVMPYAYTRMTAYASLRRQLPRPDRPRDPSMSWLRNVAKAALVAPAVCWLAHEDCSANGELFSVGGGRVARAVLADTPGYVDTHLTLEKIRDHFAQIRSDERYRIHADAMERAIYHYEVVQEARNRKRNSQP
jgi:NAD(P)-dependent dehydrogenase (short-subunit alcohol dehydrogenase family)